jgi:hypothetical protein
MMDLKSHLRYYALPAVVQETTSWYPPSGHKSHRNALNVRPETWRRLENIYILHEATMDQAITSCTPALVFYPFSRS